MDRRVTPPKLVTSPTWGRPPPWKQTLSNVTWDQAQFERFSYILSNGYRRDVIYKAKRK